MLLKQKCSHVIKTEQFEVLGSGFFFNLLLLRIFKFNFLFIILKKIHFAFQTNFQEKNRIEIFIQFIILNKLVYFLNIIYQNIYFFVYLFDIVMHYFVTQW